MVPNRRKLMKKIKAFVDGSYNASTKQIGAGIVLLDPSTNKVIQEISVEVKNENVKRLRNVAGELSATMRAILFAEKKGYEEIEILYDYNGIAKWIGGEWKCKDIYTAAYRDFITKHQSKIVIKFKKVQAHSGNKWNEVADLLAKRACNNKIK